MDVRKLKANPSESINPAYWIEQIRIALHCTDCDSKQVVLANAANYLELHIARLSGKAPTQEGMR